jgi:hypothetical protein
MSLSPEQKKFYENTLAVTKREINDLEVLIQEELAKVKDRLAQLQKRSEGGASDVRRRLHAPRNPERPRRSGNSGLAPAASPRRCSRRRAHPAPARGRVPRRLIPGAS